MGDCWFGSLIRANRRHAQSVDGYDCRGRLLLPSRARFRRGVLHQLGPSVSPSGTRPSEQPLTPPPIWAGRFHYRKDRSELLELTYGAALAINFMDRGVHKLKGCAQ